MKIINKKLKETQNPILSHNTLPEHLTLTTDTEFGVEQNKIATCTIGCKLSICDSVFVFEPQDIQADFNPILKSLEVAGFELTLDDDVVEEMASDLDEIQEELGISELTKKPIKKMIESGKFDSFLDKFDLSRDQLEIKRANKESEILLNAKNEIFVTIIAHFMPADFFKIWGKDHQEIIKDLQLSQYRTLKIKYGYNSPKNSHGTIHCFINGELTEIKFELSDTMHRLPPKNKSLDGQVKTFQIKNNSKSKGKLNLDEHKSRLGLKKEDNIKEYMPLLARKMPLENARYNAEDIFLTEDLNNKTQEFLEKLRQDFNLESKAVSDTTGSNVSTFIKDLIEDYFQIEVGLKKKDVNGNNKLLESSQLLNEKLKSNQLENLEDLPFNRFGVQPFLTVGGLLYSRTAKNPIIEGNLGDSDLKSCYATALSNINLYHGQPIVNSWRNKRDKPTLRELLEFINNNDIPTDGWYARVSGNLEKANNTLILSDLRFQNKRIKQKDFNDKLNRNPKQLLKFDIEKTSSRSAESCILSKEIKFGLINHDIVKCINLLPNVWREEYLDLKVDFFLYHPNHLIVDSIEEAKDLEEKLPIEDVIEGDIGLQNLKQSEHRGNVSLRFPIMEYWSQLRSKRNKLKKDGDPLQEVYKLFQNSGYGVLACENLPTFTPLSANVITAMARSRAWMMTMALNGFAPITDGTSFNWDKIPTNENFHEIINRNPSYPIHYDESIKSDIDETEMNQDWIDNDYKNHLAKFFQIPLDDELISVFDYELKDEDFIDKDGDKASTTYFNKYHNTGAGNYVKSLNDCHLLIEQTEYEFNSQHGKLKARSFDSKNKELLKWFIDCLENGFSKPYLYTENQLIKFSQGNQYVIRFLQELNQYSDAEIAHPLGFEHRVIKVMKLITRSQFVFQSHKQLLNFEKNQERLAQISKEVLSSSDFESTDRMMFSKSHTVGLGFEIMALMKKYNGDIGKVRKVIADCVESGITNFNAKLNLGRNVKTVCEKLKPQFIEMVNYKFDEDSRLFNLCLNTASEPTAFTCNHQDVSRLIDWLKCNDDDEVGAIQADDIE